MRVLVCFLFLFLTFIAFPAFTSYAESDYVLPYPSFMPGSKFYQLQLFKDAVLKYWYFGNFAQFTYNLKQSDKYLVEAKTLFEYKQYLLGHSALEKSDVYFSETKPYLLRARKEGKNISKNMSFIKDAALKHIEVLKKLELQVPKTFVWRPEKSLPSTLDLKESIRRSILIRSKSL